MVISRLLCLSVCLGLAGAPVNAGARPGAHGSIPHSRAIKYNASLLALSAHFTVPALSSATSVAFAPPAPSSATSVAFAPPAPVINRATFFWNPDKQGGFVMSLCADLRGRLFVGTEDKGVWMYDPLQLAFKAWTQFTTKDGLGDDNAYALCCDRLGRIWAGNLNHGVSVFNGKSWKNFDILTGPLGSHVVALAVNPTNGDVWGASEAGLFRYREKHRDWQYITRADGLPSDLASCLAFTKTGTLYIGTECDGLAIGDANAEHPKWRTVRGLDTLPLTASGEGLPSNLINCLLVTDDALYVGTTTGLAYSKDGAKTFQFVRGKDYTEKIMGLMDHPKVADDAPEGALAEDYVTALVSASDSSVVVGCRSMGPALWPEIKFSTTPRGPSDPLDHSDYTTVALRTADHTLLLGHYGDGLHLVGTPLRKRAVRYNVSVEKARPWPNAAGPADLAQLNASVQSAEGLSATAAFPTAVYLTDDWRTQGDWLGRYGRYWACMFAMSNNPFNYIWGANADAIDYRSRIGPNCRKWDSVRSYVTTLYTNEPRSLEMPPTYYDSRVKQGDTHGGQTRRQSECNDDGQQYPMSLDGPDNYFNISVPSGVFVLSLYVYNNDGHVDNNRFRDYIVSIRSMPPGIDLATTVGMAAQPELAHARIRQFCGGVWKRFLVCGPQRLSLQMRRNYSFNTKVSALTLDSVDELPAPYFGKRARVVSNEQKQPANPVMGPTLPHPALPAPVGPVVAEADGWRALLLSAEQAAVTSPERWAVTEQILYPLIFRHYSERPARINAPADWASLGTACYRTNLFDQWEACLTHRNLVTVRQFEKIMKWDGKSEHDDEAQVVQRYLRFYPEIAQRNGCDESVEGSKQPQIAMPK